MIKFVDGAIRCRNERKTSRARGGGIVVTVMVACCCHSCFCVAVWSCLCYVSVLFIVNAILGPCGMDSSCSVCKFSSVYGLPCNRLAMAMQCMQCACFSVVPCRLVGCGVCHTYRAYAPSVGRRGKRVNCAHNTTTYQAGAD